MKLIKQISAIVIILGAILGIGAYILSLYVKKTSENRIITAEEAVQKSDIDCILVLGAGVKSDGTPSHMLEDRLITAIDLYENGAAPKIIMSGDHGSENYDEVNVMKDFAIAHGVPSEDIFMDHAGFSTYESMYRARDIFEVKTAITVTQKYHLYRALFLAESLGIDTYGVPADLRTYRNQSYREAREILARAKDFFYAVFKPKPTYLGDVIPVSGNGDLSND